jgi:hypothetical protein
VTEEETAAVVSAIAAEVVEDEELVGVETESKLTYNGVIGCIFAGRLILVETLFHTHPGNRKVGPS